MESLEKSPSGKVDHSEKGSAANAKADKKARRAAKVQQQILSGHKEDTQKATTISSVQNNESNVESCNKDRTEEIATSKKALTKAERRAIQEAQRSAKESKKQQSLPQQKASQQQPPPATKTQEKKAAHVEEQKNQAIVNQPSAKKSVKLKKTKNGGFFAHLLSHSPLTPSADRTIHPAIQLLGQQYHKGIICGSNARAVSLICALDRVITDLTIAENRELSKDLSDTFRICVDYLNKCRPLSVSMLSVIKYIKPLMQDCRDKDLEKAKADLKSNLMTFYQERIFRSDEEIADKTANILQENDVIMTYGHSSLILKVLETALKVKPNISVIIVDSLPKLEGKEMAKRLIKSFPEASCSYMLMSSLSYVMPRVNKVILGAHAVLANGFIMSRVGTSQIALMAKAYNKPVLVCCETYKFSDRMQTDSIVYNELGDPDKIMPSYEKDSVKLKRYNLFYDVTPPNYVTGLVTESGIIPCTSAPVVIRVKQQF